MGGFAESSCVQWDGMDIETHLEGRLDMRRQMLLHQHFHEFHDYLDAVMVNVLSEFEDEIIEFINQKIAIYVEDELEGIKNYIDEKVQE